MANTVRRSRLLQQLSVSNNNSFNCNNWIVRMRRDVLPDLGSRELMAVIAVAQYRSFMAAAASLNLSQPAMTRMIKRVESELGVALFIRTTRQVAITEAGHEFAALAQRLLNDLKINVVHLRGKTGQLKGQVVVSSVFSLADAILPSLAADFGSRFPGIELHLREGLNATVRDEVRSGLADFGVSYIEDAAEPFSVEVLRTDGFHVVAPKDHAFAGRRSVSLAALATVPLVSFPAESLTRRIVDRAAIEAGVTLGHTMTVNRLATLHALVSKRVGLAVVPEKERPASSDPHLISRPLAGHGLARKVGIIRLPGRDLSAAAARFLDVVRNWLRSGAKASSFRVRAKGRIP
jgi:DNA-binding transcriptional LysR family regulator